MGSTNDHRILLMVIRVTVQWCNSVHWGFSTFGIKIQSNDQKMLAHVLSLDNPISSNDIKISESTLLHETRD